MCICIKIDKVEESYKIADEDIICYRILYLAGGNLYVSPIRGYTVASVNDIIGYTDMCISPSVEMLSRYPGYAIVGAGVIHSYKEDPRDILSLLPSNMHLFKCIIPKGTRYVEGLSGALIKEEKYVLAAYGSKKITYIERIY